MNCDCIKKVSAKMVEVFTPTAGPNVTATCGGLGINFDTGSTVIAIPWTIRGTAKSFNTICGKKTTMVASFCPFCGISTKAKADEVAA